MAADYHFWQLLGLGALMAFGLFALTWLVSLKLNNFSFVDAMWAYSLPLVVVIYVWLGAGNSSRRGMAMVMAGVWGLRLGSYLLIRISKHHPHEDVRYEVLRQKWKGNLAGKFFIFFEAQALLLVLLSVPLLLACLNGSPSIHWIEWVGFGVWLSGIVGEAMSDAQMGRFKSNPANKGKVCQEGLWKWSRHPNYFFEFVTWVGFWLFSCGSPWGWVTIFAPALILYFLLRVTGIPLTEKCSVESKGEAYREYQRTTSAFIPWPRKSKASH
ncbi:DUF1295 domain-containing protein [Phragmitibacter flavus]|uniref:DUF1295 domain-containing protein n=1 Tax=Phragmitibacter flavus TaxID=2576071 RepID=A0A5R8K8M3_9BACT|nr:DUF1295 domain-containing protein [Phragmitibacter flavus]TLD68305.1 DUF1295 domain-containing protein [Phragmitibacter flavus]